MNIAVAAFMKLTSPYLYYSEKPQPFGSQLQAQLQQRGLENEEATIESVGFIVQGLRCHAGQSQTQAEVLKALE